MQITLNGSRNIENSKILAEIKSLRAISKGFGYFWVSCALFISLPNIFTEHSLF